MPISKERRERLRESLINGAIEEFMSHGFVECSVDDIIRKAGGSRTNIYTYFGGKQGLFIASIEVLSGNIFSPLRTVNLSEGDVGQALFNFGSTYLQAVLADSYEDRSRSLAPRAR